MSKHLIIFIKNPELGKAKTRIAKTTGDERALEIYKELLDHTRNITCRVEAHRHLFYSSFIDTQDVWSADLFNKKLQIQGGLGEKMQDAFTRTQQEGGSMVIIGSDCGALQTEIIEQAFIALQEHDVVLGPTYDGGYYLLGLKNAKLDLFSNIDWSTEQVYPQTVQKIKDQHLTYAELTRLHDIDFEEDYLAWKASL